MVAIVWFMFLFLCLSSIYASSALHLQAQNFASWVICWKFWWNQKLGSELYNKIVIMFFKNSCRRPKSFRKQNRCKKEIPVDKTISQDIKSDNKRWVVFSATTKVLKGGNELLVIIALPDFSSCLSANSFFSHCSDIVTNMLWKEWMNLIIAFWVLLKERPEEFLYYHHLCLEKIHYWHQEWQQGNAITNRIIGIFFRQ